MTTYKKSLLSIATAVAITSTALSADYIPLTTLGGVAGHDDQWVLFGVAGLKTDGTVDAVAGVFTIDDNTSNAATDITFDEIATDAFLVQEVDGVGSSYAGSVKAINSGAANVEVRVNTAGVLFDPTEAVRTVYVDSTVPADGAPDFAVNYKASMEG